MKPLADFTVVDLTANMPGPFCSTIMSDLGARVVKVEPPDGDPLRHKPAMWASVNRGKESIALDLKSSKGRKVLGELAVLADAVLEGWRPGVAKRLGADYETLSKSNPGLVYCSISGFGQHGPWRDRPGHDLNYLALSGYLGLQSIIEGRPWPPGVLVSDVAAGLYATIAVLAALTEPRSTRPGVFIDLSMAEAALALLAPEIGRASEKSGFDGSPNVTSIPHYGVFRCSDGGWLSLGIVHEDHFWERFCRAANLGEPGRLKFAERMARAGELRELIEEAIARKPAAEWERTLTEADVPAAAVADLEAVLESQQFQHRGVFAGAGPDRSVSQPMRFSTGSVAPTKGPPDLGENTRGILSELGYPGDYLSNTALEAMEEVEIP